MAEITSPFYTLNRYRLSRHGWLADLLVDERAHRLGAEIRHGPWTRYRSSCNHRLCSGDISVVFRVLSRRGPEGGN
ncbi:MAG: hypothetical protein JO249_24710 [Acidobacteria bacterium]|nr:hypothetical protein [Acidobacteriota bacterium]MBV9483923.1 hypothetical protein [Acidobacteriota bacterium]